jgi:hypothetical protein
MTTWICKGAVFAGVLLGLGACDGVETAGLLGSLSSIMPAENVALSETQMANGALTLVPPDGFCIDKSSLRQSFALMARCDKLGAASLAGGAPVGLITISVTALDPEASLPTPQELAEASKLTELGAEKSKGNALTFSAKGEPPARGLAESHWRGLARVGDQMISLALFGPEGARAVTIEGREILNSLIRRTQPNS